MPRKAPPRSRRAGVLAAALTVVTLSALVPAGAVVGDAAADNTYAFTTRLVIGEGERACTGALVDPYWIVTAASCFADTPAQPTVPAGPPARKATATVGRTDLTTTTGQVRDIAELVPRTDRDLVLARLATPVTDITPVAVTATAPTPGEELRATGYGRTRTEWVPDKLHTALFTVGAVDPTGLGITPKSPADAALCKGDTGGPALRRAGDRYELAALTSRSWQNGCLGAAPTTRTGAYETRTDDLGSWIQQTVAAWNAVVSGRFGTRNTVYNPDTKTAELFTLRADGALIHAYNTNGQGWNGWHLVGPGARFVGTPAVVHDPVTNTLELFATSTDGSMYRAAWSRVTGWQPWTMSGDWKYSGSPVTVYNPDTRTAEVFALRTDGVMAHLYNTDGVGWHGPFTLNPSGAFVGTPAVVHNPVTNTLELFATSTDGSMYRAAWSRAAGWTSWIMAGDWKYGGSPVTVYNPDTRTAEVFALRTDGVMAHLYNTDGVGWEGPFTLNPGGRFTGVPSVLHNPAGNTLEVFAVGTDGSMYRATWSRATGWGPWTMTGAWRFGNSPSAVYNPDTRVAEVFGQGTDGVMAHATKVADGAWSGWSIVGQIPTTG
ncbi:trypsin-like serine protease [Kitasatospora purpeofusca]|uniref:trypsin-like serine protease n=1 Tax=Kitasatospora purpeofusca TaxID=67352 RepID=UPI002A5A56E6|nr:trypsin-like serine protease [Kitasatospora purpeofusca]MDY0814825.1 trypsin-like serine protease [Kitasatospora purpeofusca]